MPYIEIVKTDETVKELIELSKIIPLTDENIKWIFINNPRFEALFTDKYPNFTKETFLENAYELLTSLGFEFGLTRLTTRKTSSHYCVCGYSLHFKGTWIHDAEMLHETNVLKSWMFGCLENIKMINR